MGRNPEKLNDVGYTSRYSKHNCSDFPIVVDLQFS
jgi:hypothetical protein